MKEKLYLASDNWAPAHPDILEAFVEANQGFAPGYGADRWTEEAKKIIQSQFKTSGKVLMVPTGTGANVLALKLAVRPYESIICTDIAHISYHECGALEALIGCKLLTVPHHQGKVTPSALLKKIKTERAFGKHSTSPKVLSITQPTELGTVYTPDELKELSQMCREEGLFLHIDGSRIYNAAAYLDLPLHEVIRGDLLSLGGTKNGLFGAEALIILNQDLEEGSDHFQKQTLALLSKMRYLSSQYIPFFKNDLWKTLALSANQRAKELKVIIRSFPELKLSYPVETNQLFFQAPLPWIQMIQEEIFCYPWDQEKQELRWIASWNTTQEEVLAVQSVLEKIAKELRR